MAAKKLGIYLIERVNRRTTWDTTTDAVLVARDEADARQQLAEDINGRDEAKVWLNPRHSTVKLIGKAESKIERGLLVHFNTGA